VKRRKKENQGCVTFFWCNPQIELKLFYNSHLLTSTNYPLGGIGFTPFLSLSKTKSTKISLATSRQMKKIGILACFLPCFIGCQEFFILKW